MSTSMFDSKIVAIALGLFLLSGLVAQSETINFKVDLKGSNEVPPNDAKGTGVITATFDTVTKKLSWNITHSGLTANPTMSHFHGPSNPYRTAPIIIPIPGNLVSPIEGSVMLTDEQANDLMNGRWYLNVHTAAHPPGEIRGQMIPSTSKP